MSICWRLTALVLLVFGTPTVRAELPPLIPRAILFGNPQRSSPQLSPDGRYLAYIAPDKKNVLQVWLRTLGQKDDHPITADPKRGIRSYFWTFDGEHLVYSQDKDGDENTHLYAVNVKTDKVRDLTPFPGAKAQLVDVDPRFPREMLVSINVKDKHKFDVYRVNLISGEAAFDTENPGSVIDWTADANFKVRAATAATPDGGYDLLVRPSSLGKEWQAVRHWGPEESGSALFFAEDGKTLYLRGNHDADTIRLVKLNLGTKKETVVAEDPHYDMGGILMHPVRRQIQAVGFNRDKLTWKVLDPGVAEDFKALTALRAGQFSVSSRNLADNTWLVSYTTDDGPVYYYTYDRDKKKGKLLFSHQPKLEGLPLAHMQPISFPSRDGLTVHGYLTTPIGVPAKNLPAVLLVHGGPWAHDSWGYNPLVQWLANRGYAVLQVNYRGSSGYGKKFLNAGNKEWAAKMHNDLIDAVRWLEMKGVADPKRIAIMGGSYGGYATLVGLTFTPEVFAAGVDIVGPSNLVTLLKTIPPYWAPAKAMFAKRVGDLEKEEKLLKERSPLNYVDKIRAPLLIGQGANDPRVKQAESDQIYEALKKANKPVEYVIYKDEGHGFARPENRMHFYAIAEAFLARHIGGRAQPLGEVKGNSAVIKK